MSSSIRTIFIAILLILAACSQVADLGHSGRVEGGVVNAPDGGVLVDAPTSVDSGGGAPISPYCLEFGQICASGLDCCSGLCDPTTKTCVSSINVCTATGGRCLSSTECCSMSCTVGQCSVASCIADQKSCTDSSACCSGNCQAGLCVALNSTCRTAGNPCTTGSQCCSSLCEAGTCKLGASFCIQTGDVCSDSATCCSGNCTKGTGSLGVCASPPSGPTNCSDGIDGTVCGACNNCCSRLCAPYAPTGVRVCQPASGCRVNGDLCRKDNDCCGAAGTGLPGDGNVVCDITAGKAIGICRNPRSCNPQGNTCHYQNYTCSNSSARNDCCGGVGNSGVCQLDFLGVPRCNGLGNTCRQVSDTCSSSMDCCDQAPCVPDSAGVLRCYGTPGGPDGGVVPACVPVAGPCSINGDCCPGSTCIQSMGSTQGVCGNISPPPWIPPTNPAVDASAPGCAVFGQNCTTPADCCNGVACIAGKCVDLILQ